jgi:hypothetical protein
MVLGEKPFLTDNENNLVFSLRPLIHSSILTKTESSAQNYFPLRILRMSINQEKAHICRA